MDLWAYPALTRFVTLDTACRRVAHRACKGDASVISVSFRYQHDSGKEVHLVTLRRCLLRIVAVWKTPWLANYLGLGFPRSSTSPCVLANGLAHKAIH